MIVPPFLSPYLNLKISNSSGPTLSVSGLSTVFKKGHILSDLLRYLLLVEETLGSHEDSVNTSF